MDAIFECMEGDNSLEAYFLEDKLYVSIDNPWRGDSESGFGQECSINLDKSAIKDLIKFLVGLEKESNSDR